MANPTTKKMKFHIKTWGCQMNYADTGKIEILLHSIGYVKASGMADSDLIIFNTCSVRQRAEDKVTGMGRKIISLRKKNPRLKVIMTGCMAHRIRRNCPEDKVDLKYSRALKRRLPWVDHFVDIGDLSSIRKIVTGKKVSSENHTMTKNSNQSSIRVQQSEFSAYVPISEGCDNFCTFCIVPFTRGSLVHRSFDEVYDEVKSLVKDGYKMITLLGQNVNSWEGKYHGKKMDFAGLLDRISRIRGKFWLTFLTSHPKDFSNDLADVMASRKKICPYLNLAIQSGSNKILAKMNRNYTWMDYISKVEYLREKIPDIRLSTDVIVGFPGETEDDFEETYMLVKKLRFGMIYVSEYSSREGTASAKLKDSVCRAEKKRRKKKIEDIERKIIEDQNNDLVGKKVNVLVLDEGFGKTHDLRDVRVIGAKKDIIGEFVSGMVTKGTAGGVTVEVK